jgi:hypothetical protein
MVTVGLVYGATEIAATYPPVCDCYKKGCKM